MIHEQCSFFIECAPDRTRLLRSALDRTNRHLPDKASNPYSNYNKKQKGNLSHEKQKPVSNPSSRNSFFGNASRSCVFNRHCPASSPRHLASGYREFYRNNQFVHMSRGFNYWHHCLLLGKESTMIKSIP